ncbi:MAG: diadenylate cyclase [Deltaproteobacteria bacterium]|nr:diadenylate cyclase [Deltaproteobacteria bacterium]MDH3384297.1 diadenylate cyclase [Deltaproteobacteria bacterium]
MLGALPAVRLVDILDILLVAVIFYWILLFIRGTRAVEILFGLLFLMGVFILSKRVGMVTFQWVVGNFFGGFIIILAVIFQSEIRRGLARMGRIRIFGWPPLTRRPGFLEDLAASAFLLAESRTGALILLERNMGLSEYIEHGKKIDAVFSYELLASLVSPLSPVHDGAVVIRGERIATARVILPIPPESPATRAMGTRHRAAWGMGVETDAISIVVSEETGNVSAFFDHKIKMAANARELEEILREQFEA